MKTRKKFIDNVRQMYAQHENAIQIVGIAILLIAIFIAGYLVSWNFLEKPLKLGQPYKNWWVSAVMQTKAVLFNGFRDLYGNRKKYL